MTKARALVATVALLLLATAPSASAHGAPEARELDARILVDDDGGLGYGGCIEVCNPASPPEGIAFDVREAWLDDAPAIVFRIVHQYEAVHDGRGFTLSVTAAGTPHTFEAASDDAANYTTTTFARLDGPFDVGDGHPKALDAWVLASTLNVSAGDALAGITLSSTHHGEPDDVMPGTWFSQGLEVPHLPHDPGEVAASTEPGAYTVKGPADLLQLTTATKVVDLALASTVALDLTNALASLPQSVTWTLVADGGVLASLEGSDSNGSLLVNLDPAASRSVSLAVDPASASGNLSVVVRSDLGARAVALLQVVAPPPAPTDNATADGHDDHASADTGSKDTPAPAAVLALAPLAAAFARRRRAKPDDGSDA